MWDTVLFFFKVKFGDKNAIEFHFNDIIKFSNLYDHISDKWNGQFERVIGAPNLTNEGL